MLVAVKRLPALEMGSSSLLAAEEEHKWLCGLEEEESVSESDASLAASCGSEGMGRGRGAERISSEAYSVEASDQDS